MPKPTKNLSTEQTENTQNAQPASPQPEAVHGLDKTTSDQQLAPITTEQPPSATNLDTPDAHNTTPPQHGTTIQQKTQILKTTRRKPATAAAKKTVEKAIEKSPEKNPEKNSASPPARSTTPMAKTISPVKTEKSRKAPKEAAEAATALQQRISQKKLEAAKLTHTLDISQLPKSTRVVEPLTHVLGQERALAAMHTALKLPNDGYNIFAAGTQGLGKRTIIKRLLKQHALNCPTPSDFVYVNNFSDPRTPIAIEFTAGQGIVFKKHIHTLWRSIYTAILRRFGGQQFLKQAETIKQRNNEEQQNELLKLKHEGEKLSLCLVAKNEEQYFVPARFNAEESSDVQLMNNAEINKLPKAKRQKLVNDLNAMNKKLDQLSLKFTRMEEDTRDRISSLTVDIASDIVDSKIQPLLNQYKTHKVIGAYLKLYADDIVENIETILQGEDEDFLDSGYERVPTRYQVNIITDNSTLKGAPVIEEDLPTYFNLMGYIEQETYMGTISTDFSLIRAGSLHKANGGFLILEAEQLLEQPYAWHGLKRALRSKQIKLSSLEQMLTLTGTISLAPAAIPLSVKVVLIGDPYLYYEMLELDPEFNALFKIRADFADTLPRTQANEHDYIRLIADFCKQKSYLALDQSALAALLRDSSRNAEEQDKLSLNASSLSSILAESHAIAKAANARVIAAKHIEQCLHDREYRLGFLKDLYWQDLQKGTQLIQTLGKVIGQVNALTVIHYADSEFGMPARLTAIVYQGNGEILDIERTVELGGNLHAKGVLIMTSFLRAHFGRFQPLNFSAALAFEQSYSDIDGDSATLAEVVALISAITQLPAAQHIGITGSMNQLGQAQPIGGVTAKIEGFYDAAKLQGLNGHHGVIIPAQNQHHLMLKPEVIDAVQKGLFHIYAIHTVEEALEIMLQQPAGQMDNKGQYPKNTIYGQVMAALKHWQVLEHGGNAKKGRKRK